MNRTIGYVGILALAISACAAPQGGEETEGMNGPAPAADTDDGDTSSAPGEAVAGESKEVASLELGEGHRVSFIAVDESVLVVEIGAQGQSALSRLTELGAGTTARDVFHALSRPGIEAPEAISRLGETIAGHAQGWGLELVPQQTMSGGHNACNDATFTASTYGGILPDNGTWLNRHPGEEYDEYLYTDGDHTQHFSPRVAFHLTRPNTLQFRGKGCLEVKEGAGQPLHRYYDPSVGHSVDRNPQMSLLARKSGTTSWYAKVNLNVPVGVTQPFEWAWFGAGSTRYDWQFRVIRAQPQDYIDYMRSYLD
jgi:hypothetical protein